MQRTSRNHHVVLRRFHGQESLAREQSGVTIAPFAMQPVDSTTAQDMDGIQTLFNITNFLLAQDHPPSVLLTNVQYEEAAFQQAPEIAQYAMFVT